jgi:hypothetical protein
VDLHKTVRIAISRGGYFKQPLYKKVFMIAVTKKRMLSIFRASIISS